MVNIFKIGVFVIFLFLQIMLDHFILHNIDADQQMWDFKMHLDFKRIYNKHTVNYN